MSALTVVLTKLHAGGKFGGDGYKVSGGLHGVGLSVVNALSERLVAEVTRDGKLYRQEFERGVPTTDLVEVGDGGGHRHDDQLPAGRRDLQRGHGLQRRDTRPAPARDRVPHARPADRPRRRARGRGPARVPLRGRDPRLRQLRERREGARPQAGHLLRGRGRRAPRRRRGCDAVEHLVQRVGLHVREQHQHARGRLAPVRASARR